MEFSRRTAQLLHEDHHATIAVIEALEELIARAKRSIPDALDPANRKTLKKVAEVIDQEVSNHFAFEEKELFTRLAENGDVGIGMHLTEEHQAMLPVAKQVSNIARSCLAIGFTDQTWSEFTSCSYELIERMLSHIQKEEMALLPMVEELLDPETDMELAEAYSLNQ
jgi:hemerythrin-like domain-containing protein